MADCNNAEMKNDLKNSINAVEYIVISDSLLLLQVYLNRIIVQNSN